MIIDFDKLMCEEMPSFKGGEGVVMFYSFDDAKNKIFKAILKPNCSIGFHKHETSQEIMYLIDGTLEVNDDGNKTILNKGQATYCPINHSHGVTNIGDKPATLFCVVTCL